MMFIFEKDDLHKLFIGCSAIRLVRCYTKTTEELVQIFGEIPTSVESLDLSISGIDSKTGEELVRIFSAIPRSVTSLDLSNFHSKTAEELVRVFSAIPRSVTSLNLADSYFDSRTGEELVRIFNAIPLSVISLDLSSNKLGFKTGKELVRILNAIPRSVISLNLSHNWIGRKTSEELAQVFNAIPATVTSLYLKGNKLDSRTGQELGQALKSIPTSVTSLDLSYNELGSKPGEELAQVFNAIPAAVTSLGLKGNELDSRTGQELAQVFNAIPATVTSLGLKGDSKTGEELVRIFSAIPPSVITFDLSYNWLGEKTGEELVRIFSVIPLSVTSLNLSFNRLGLKTGEELAQIFSAIPLSVTSLNLSHNWLGRKTGEELVQIFSAIPLSVTSLDLSSNILGLKSVEELVDIFSKIPLSLISLNLSSNMLGLKSVEELVDIFSKIPLSLISLNLSSNMLDSKTGEELVQIFNEIPRLVTSLDLSSNMLGLKSVEELVGIFSKIPLSVTSLDLSSNMLDSKAGEELAQIFSAIPLSVTSLTLGGGVFTLEELIVQVFSGRSESVSSLNLNDNGKHIKSNNNFYDLLNELPQISTHALANIREKNNFRNVTNNEKICAEVIIKIANEFYDNNNDKGQILSYFFNATKDIESNKEDYKNDLWSIVYCLAEAFVFESNEFLDSLYEKLKLQIIAMIICENIKKYLEQTPNEQLLFILGVLNLYSKEEFIEVINNSMEYTSKNDIFWNVNEFFIKNYPSFWLQKSSKITAQIWKNGVARIIKNGMNDPYNHDYMHIPNFEIASCVNELILENNEPRIQVIQDDSASLQNTITDNAIHSPTITNTESENNQNVVFSENIQQEDQTELSSSSIFSMILNTFEALKWFEGSKLNLLKRIVDGFSEIIQDGLFIENNHDALKNISKLLAFIPFDSAQILEKAYFQPLLYLMDENNNQLPNHDQLPISREKLKAIKKLYWGMSNWNKNTYSNVSCAIATGEIIHSLLVITDQDKVLLDWLSGLLEGNNIFSTNSNGLMNCLSSKKNDLIAWVDFIPELDCVLNLASFQAAQDSEEKQIQQTILNAIESIIGRTDNLEIFNDTSLEINENDRLQILADISERVTDFQQLRPDCGLTRYHNLFLIAALYYERNDLSDKAEYLLSISFTIDLIERLTAISSFDDLMTVAKEIQEPLLSGNLGIIPQILGLALTIHLAKKELQTATSNLDFCIKLNNQIENNIPNEWALAKSISASLSTGLNIAKVLGTSSNNYEKICQLKELEKEIVKSSSDLSKEQITSLRFIVSGQYIYDLIDANRPLNAENIVDNAFIPLALIWGEAELAATFILAPKLVKSFQDIYANGLNADNCFKSITVAMKEANKSFKELEKIQLLDRSSNIYTITRRGETVLTNTKKVYEAGQTFKNIISQMKVLKSSRTSLSGIIPNNPQVSEAVHHFGKIINALENGTPEDAQEAILKLPNVVSNLKKAGVIALKIGISACKAVSALGVVGVILSLVDLGATIYYGQKIIKKLEAMSEQMQANHQQLLSNQNHISNQIDAGVNAILDGQDSLLKQMELNFNNVIVNQKLIYETIQNIHADLTHKINMAQDHTTFINIKFEIMRRLQSHCDILEQILDNINNFNLVKVNDALSNIYLVLVYRGGLSYSPSNGEDLTLESAYKGLFLAKIFNANLPNLRYWIAGCNSLNYYLYRFSERLIAEELPISNHSQVILKTNEILQTLKLINSKDVVLTMLEKIGNNVDRKNNIKNLHYLAKLCGFPLHQFGESIPLWQDDNNFTIEQLEEKEFFERNIIEIYKEILSGEYNLCSPMILEVQKLLSDLMMVGMKIYGEQNLTLELQKSITKPPKQLPQPTVSTLAELGIFSRLQRSTNDSEFTETKSSLP